MFNRTKAPLEVAFQVPASQAPVPHHVPAPPRKPASASKAFNGSRGSFAQRKAERIAEGRPADPKRGLVCVGPSEYTQIGRNGKTEILPIVLYSEGQTNRFYAQFSRGGDLVPLFEQTPAPKGEPLGSGPLRKPKTSGFPAAQQIVPETHREPWDEIESDR